MKEEEEAVSRIYMLCSVTESGLFELLQPECAAYYLFNENPQPCTHRTDHS